MTTDHLPPSRSRTASGDRGAVRLRAVIVEVDGTAGGRALDALAPLRRHGLRIAVVHAGASDPAGLELSSGADVVATPGAAERTTRPAFEPRPCFVLRVC